MMASSSGGRSGRRELAGGSGVWITSPQTCGSVSPLRWVERVATVHDRLGGPPELVDEKLRVLSNIREDLDELLPRLSGDDKAFAQEWRPPDGLKRPLPEDLPPLLRAEFSEQDGTLGTPVYVHLNRKLSQSQGKNLLEISNLLHSVKLESGEVVPNAGRATVFAEMIRSMERDAPRATIAALLVVVVVAGLATRALLPLAAVLGCSCSGCYLPWAPRLGSMCA
jgi:hypothetical protein